MLKFNLFVMVILITISQAFAEINTGRSSIFFYGGATFGNTTSLATSNNRNTLGTITRSSDDGSNLIGAEYNYSFIDSWYSTSGLVEWSKYNYPDGSPGDTQLSLIIMPKAQINRGTAHFWVGLGGGLVSTELGETEYSIRGSTVVLDRHTISFGISPRAGVDFHITDNIIFGLQLAYVTTSGTFQAQRNPDGRSTTNFSGADFTRNWWNLGARVGAIF